MNDKSGEPDSSLRSSSDLGEVNWSEVVRRRTPARLLQGRAGAAYRTGTQLQLRADHAAARDAVFAEIHPDRDFGPEFVADWQLVALETLADTKPTYLMRPDLGRRLTEASRVTCVREFPANSDVQFVIGDGLSAAAVIRQVPLLWPKLAAECADRGWSRGRLLYVRHCRVGVMNDIGDLLRPRVLVLLIGERPGLATTESLSAYFGYAPRLGCTDADRNLISNIHERGVPPDDAVRRILGLIEQLLTAGRSGTLIKEPSGSPGSGGRIWS